MQLVEREYGAAINEVELALHSATNASVVEQITILTTTYIQTAPTNRALDSYLHLDAYAHIHQRSLAYITERLAAILGEIIQRGVTDGIFICVNPQATATQLQGAGGLPGRRCGGETRPEPTGNDERVPQLAGAARRFRGEIPEAGGSVHR